MLSRYIYSIIFLIFSLNILAQNTNSDLKITKKDTIVLIQNMDILAPSRAAFYSAVLPGLGQAYNKKYWKVPIVYAALGTSIYFYINNDNNYNTFQTAFKNRKAGRPDEYDGLSGGTFVSTDGLIRAQNFYKKNRDLSLFLSIAIYILNIVEANVDAHLPDKALDTNISFNPVLFSSPVTNTTMVGASVSFSF